MFKRSCSRLTDSLLQLPNQLPCVERIQQVDVAWRPAKDCDGKITSILHIHARWRLIGVGSITEGEVFHINSFVNGLCHGRFARTGTDLNQNGFVIAFN